jgi:thiol:disulfide interchange protein
MKNYFISLSAVLLMSAAAFGQTAQPAPATAMSASAESAQAKEAPIAREKFDPTRDPKADLALATKTAAKSGRNIVLDVGGEWCGWCVFMDKFFVQHPDLAKLRDANFVWVKVNFSKDNENKEFLADYPAAAGYPHLYVLDPSGKLLQSQDTSELEMGKGYNPEKFSEFLKKWAPSSAMPAELKAAQTKN